MCIAAAVAMAVTLIVEREHPVVKGTSLHFSCLILLGIPLGLFGVLVVFSKPTMGKCLLYPLMTACCFAVIVISLTVKTWRIWRIFECPLASIRNKKALSNQRLFLFVVMLVVVEIVSIIAAGTATFDNPTTLDLDNGDVYGSRRLVCATGGRPCVFKKDSHNVVVAVLFVILNLRRQRCADYCHFVELRIPRGRFVGRHNDCSRAATLFVYLTRRVRTDQFGESGWIVIFLLLSGVRTR